MTKDPTTEKAEIAFNLVMALIADFAIEDPLRLSRMQETLGRILEQLGPTHPDAAGVRAAFDAILKT